MVALTVDAIVVAESGRQYHVLLIKRGSEPYKGMWALPGGFINIDETLEKSCRRELFEETGLKVGTLTQFKAFGAVNRDPRQRTISVVFFTFSDEMTEVKGMDDATEARWFKINNLPEMAFDHSEILNEFLDVQGLLG